MIRWNKTKKRITLLEKGKEIGYLTYKWPGDISGKRNLELDYLYVKPKFRRKRLASKLLEFVFRNFKNVVWVTAWSGRQAEIDGSHDLYFKNGFKEVYYQPDYYKKGIGSRLFVKRLKKLTGIEAIAGFHAE